MRVKENSGNTEAVMEFLGTVAISEGRYDFPKFIATELSLAMMVWQRLEAVKSAPVFVQDCTHLLFLDADVAFTVDTIRKMLGAGERERRTC